MANEKSRRVLIAEDDEQIQTFYHACLGSLSVECDVVGDGAEAVQAYRESSYKLVLLDCCMPGMDGYEAARRIREHERVTGAQRTPIVSISSRAEWTQCEAAGMDCCRRCKSAEK